MVIDDEIPEVEVLPEKEGVVVVPESKDNLPFWRVLADKSNVVNGTAYPKKGMILYEGILFAPEIWDEFKELLTYNPEIKDELLEALRSSSKDRNERVEELLKDKVR